MKIRKQNYGEKNLVGKNIERLRKEKGIKQKDFIAQIQVMGCDMNPTSYSKLEGQIRSATDKVRCSCIVLMYRHRLCYTNTCVV